MSVGFMGLLTAVIAERVGLSIARWLFGPLLLAGGLGVASWHRSELRNAGDLRLYLLVQFGSLVLIVVLLALYRPRYTGTVHLAMGLVAYAAAKGLELGDREIFELGGVVSGHTLKHLAAAGGVACLVWMLHARGREAGRRSA
jgi:hypothetical protein